MPSQIIWDNEYFVLQSQKQVLILLKLDNSDIIYVSDLLDAHGEWISKKESLNKLSKE